MCAYEFFLIAPKFPIFGEEAVKNKQNPTKTGPAEKKNDTKKTNKIQQKSNKIKQNPTKSHKIPQKPTNSHKNPQQNPPN